MTDIELRLGIAFDDDVSLPELTPCSTMLLQQIVDAGLICECGKTLRLIDRILEVLSRAYCSHESETIGLTLLESHREPHSVAALLFDPAH